jgi:dihydropteroate synthase
MTEIVGIINATPDSFSDDGLDADRVKSRIDALIKDGAAIIDIGAESTRPGATPVSAEEEWERLAPIAEVLGKKSEVIFSIDTRRAAVARKALEKGFGWVNDVSGGADAQMFELAAETGARLVLMHALSIPADPLKTLDADADPVAEVFAWGESALRHAEKQGVKRSQIVFDPGIGFGKTARQSLALIRNIARFKALGVALMVGHSRKSFLSFFTDRKAADRDPETLTVSCFLAAQQVDYLRVHDVKSHAAMLKVMAAL